MRYDRATVLAALDGTWSGTVAACTGLTPEQWDAPTDLPGWTVKDNVSHLAGIERILLGEPDPDVELPDLPHVRTDAQRFIERSVHARRGVPGDDVLAEFRDVAQRRLAEIAAYSDADLAAEVDSFAGRRPLGDLLALRAFDSWVHEQDVRHALGLPGTVSGPAAEIALFRVTRALTYALADRAPGRTVTINTTGTLPGSATLRLGEQGTFAATADVHLTVDAGTFLRLGCGRVRYDDVAPLVDIVGDVALGQDLARHLTVTP
jgi:uncharacterized protein (TIGR03083 family)